MNTPSTYLSKSIIEEAILVAQNADVPDWKKRIEQMEKRIERIHEQATQQPHVPVELQDAYRAEIDNLTLENMQLTIKLNQTAQALERAKQAYKAERENTHELKEKLDDLEQRLLEYLNR